LNLASLFISSSFYEEEGSLQADASFGNGNSKGLENYEHSTFRAVCFLTSSFDLNITADKLIVTKKPSSFHTQISQS
jgi:hypothetical protein